MCLMLIVENKRSKRSLVDSNSLFRNENFRHFNALRNDSKNGKKKEKERRRGRSIEGMVEGRGNYEARSGAAPRAS